MNRRDFVKTTGSVLALSSVPLVPRWTFSQKDRVIDPLSQRKPAQGTLAMLGYLPEGDVERYLFRALSDDVFERAMAALRGQSYRLVTGQRVGEAFALPAGRDTREAVTLTHQFNTDWQMDSRDLGRDVIFDLTRFRSHTNHWRDCLAIDYVHPTIATDAAFNGRRLMGLPMLPSGLLGTAHYIDEATGLTMRALMAFQVLDDHYTMRWDVLCG